VRRARCAGGHSSRPSRAGRAFPPSPAPPPHGAPSAPKLHTHTHTLTHAHSHAPPCHARGGRWPLT
jgi:hypothetical protein